MAVVEEEAVVVAVAARHLRRALRVDCMHLDLLDAGAVQNPCAGTVLDHDITMRDLYDFYLVSFHSLFYILPWLILALYLWS